MEECGSKYSTMKAYLWFWRKGKEEMVQLVPIKVENRSQPHCVRQRFVTGVKRRSRGFFTSQLVPYCLLLTKLGSMRLECNWRTPASSWTSAFAFSFERLENTKKKNAFEFPVWPSKMKNQRKWTKFRSKNLKNFFKKKKNKEEERERERIVLIISIL